MKLFVYQILKFLCGTEAGTDKINRSGLWSTVSIVFTIILIWFAFVQIKEVNKTTHAEFTHKIKDDFFTKTNINLLTLLDEEVLKLDTSNDVAWFNLDTVRYKKLHKDVSLNGMPLEYQSNQMDALLQNFEDFGLYEKKGLVDLDYVTEGYDFYIVTVWENPEIKAYIMWLRGDPKGANAYFYFEYIYKKLNSK